MHLLILLKKRCSAERIGIVPGWVAIERKEWKKSPSAIQTDRKLSGRNFFEIFKLRHYFIDNSLEFLGVIFFSVIAGCGENGVWKDAIVKAFWIREWKGIFKTISLGISYSRRKRWNIFTGSFYWFFSHFKFFIHVEFLYIDWHFDLFRSARTPRNNRIIFNWSKSTLFLFHHHTRSRKKRTAR